MGPKRNQTRPAQSTTTLDSQPEPTSITMIDEEENILPSGFDAETRINIDDRDNTEDDDDDDPVTREYDVFLNGDLEEKLMLFQYPNREKGEPYTEEKNSKPTELRWKPHAGIVEVDIPMEIFSSYDKEKGIEWGHALKNSTDARAGGSLGLAGGFGIGSAPARIGNGPGRGSKKDEDDSKQPEILFANFINANRVGRVLNKQTLGGQINLRDDDKPIYMLGSFRNNQLHLTPIDSVAQLRPQFHHLDAQREQERSSQRAQRDMGNPPRQQEARAIHMAVKSADGDDMDIVGTTNTLKAAQEENWTYLEYVDDNTGEAWAAYEKLFIKDPITAPRIESNMKHDELLDVISASKVEMSRPARKLAGGKGARENDGPNKAKSASSKQT